MLTAERLRELFDYDPATGAFTRLVRMGHHLPGPVAFNRSYRYLSLGVDGRRYQLHRLAWLHVHGVWPPGRLDHADDNGHHNWLSNLRPATNSQNMCNTGLRSDNTSGLKGVSFDVARGKWFAKVQIDGNQHALGRFDTKELAAACVAEARVRLHGEFARHA